MRRIWIAFALLGLMTSIATSGLPSLPDDRQVGEIHHEWVFTDGLHRIIQHVVSDNTDIMIWYYERDGMAGFTRGDELVDMSKMTCRLLPH